MTEMNVCVIVAAAGRSSRFGESDKLSQDLGGRAVLVRTVEAFARRKEVRSVVVAAPADRFDDYRERFGPTLGFHGATIVKGGTVARWESIRLAIEAVPADATHIAVHDAARPVVDDALLDRMFEAAESLDAVIPGTPISGTVKRVAIEPTIVGGDGDDDLLADSILGESTRVHLEANAVEETVDRAHLVEVQTPQIFDADLLRRAYAAGDLDGVTDDAGAVERLGETVHVVAGDPRNVKITVPADIDLVRKLLGLRGEKERPVHKRF
ncbi:MAG: IspD/TarI family cytidylyltransferase [Planctomycetota bacterium]|jgi:2-C-methyl-D-erythritol 4-phosphate cytidylyltransferase